MQESNQAVDTISAKEYFEKGVKFLEDYKTFQEALKCFMLSAKEGYPPAYLYLGIMQQNYAYKCQDIKKSKYYYDLAARKMEWFQAEAKTNSAEAQYHLGILYRNGQGIKKNNEYAYKYFNLAATNGHPKAAGERDAIRLDNSNNNPTRAENKSNSGKSEQPQKSQRLDENGKSKERKRVDTKKEVIQVQQPDQTIGLQTRSQKRKNTNVSKQPQKKQRLDEKTPAPLSMANRQRVKRNIEIRNRWGMFGNQKKQAIKAIVVQPTEVPIITPSSRV